MPHYSSMTETTTTSFPKGRSVSIFTNVPLPTTVPPGIVHGVLAP